MDYSKEEIIMIKCSICNKEFSSYLKRDSHYITKHVKEALFGEQCDSLNKAPEDPLENLRKAMLAMQAISKPIIEIQNRFEKAMKPLVTLTSAIQKYMEPFQKMGELFAKYIKQIRQNFIDAISIIDTPENS